MADKNLGELIFDLALDDKKFQAAIENAIATINRLNTSVANMSRAASTNFKTASTNANAFADALGRINKQSAGMGAGGPAIPSRFPSITPQSTFTPIVRDDRAKNAAIVTQALQKLAKDEAIAVTAAEEQKRKEYAKTEREREKQTKSQMDALRAISSLAETVGAGAARVASSIELIGAAATAAFGTLVAVSVSAGAEFQQNIRAAAVISSSDFDTLSQAAQRFGRDTKFSADEAAVAMRNFAQAGLKAGDNIAATEASINLASASNSDLASSSTLVATTIKQFGIAASETSDVADIFSYAMNNSKLDVESLSQSMKYAGVIGRGLGMSLEDTTAAIMMLSDIGNVGSKAGTVFRLAMMRASATTAEADRILAHYGLTQKDINPETKRFSEILDVVAKKNLSVAEATKIFGLQAGASIVTLSRQQAILKVLGKSYEDLVRGLQEAAKSDLAAKKTAEMLNSVKGQFTILKSSLESVSIKIFEAYAGPLQGFLTQATQVVNTVIRFFAVAGNSIDTSIGTALRSLTEYMAANQSQLTTLAISILSAFGEVGRQLMSLGPTLVFVVEQTLAFANGVYKVLDAFAALLPGVDTAAQLLVDIWAVSKLIVFISWLGRLPAVIAGVGTALAALRAEITVTTGGLYAIAAVLGGAAVYALAKFGSTASKTAGQVDELTRAEQRYKQVTDAITGKQTADITKAMEASQSYYRERVKSGKALTEGEKKEAQTILDLSASMAEAEVAAGRLAIINGRLVTTTRIASEAQTKNGLDMQKLADAFDQVKRRASDTYDVFIDLHEAYKVASRAAEGAASSEEKNARFMAALDPKYRARFTSMSEASEALRAFREQSEKAKQAEDAFANQVAKTAAVVDDETDALDGLDKGKPKKPKLPKVSPEVKELATLEDAFKRLSESANDYYEKSQRALDNAEFPAVKALEDQVAQMKEKFDAAITAGVEAVKKGAKLQSDIVELQDKEIETERLMRLAAAKTAADDADKASAELLQKIKDEEMSAQEKRDVGRRAELAAESKKYAELEQLAKFDSDALKKVTDDRRAALAAINHKWDQNDLKAKEELSKKITELLTTANEKYNKEIASSEKDTLTESQRIRRDTAAKILEIETDVTKGIEEAMQKEGKTGEEIKNAQIKALEELKAKRDKLIADSERRAKKAMGPYDYLRQAIVKAFGEDAGKSLDNLKKKFDEVGGNAKRIAGIIAKVFKGAFGAIKGGFDVVMGVVQQISGFSLNILGTIQDAIGFVQNEQKAAVEDASARAKAAGFDPVQAERRAKAATRPESLATKFVQDLVGNAVEITKLFVAVVGPVISELAAQLPSLFTAVANAIPQIVTAFAQNIGPLVAAIVQGAPKVALALIESIPTIATALVEAILYDLIPKLPGIAWDLVTAIWQAFWETIKSVGGKIGQWFADKLGTDTGGPAAYSGMDYVPSTMRATLHQGEAVIPADRNARRLRGATAPAPAGADQNYGGRGGMGGFGPLEVAVIAEGRLLEAVQMRAEDMGRATGMGKRIRKAAGVKVGFSRGDYNPWSR